MISEKLEKSLSHRTPQTVTLDAQGRSAPQRIEALRVAAKALGEAIETLTRPSREQSLAVTNLEQSLMWAIKSVVLE